MKSFSIHILDLMIYINSMISKLLAFLDDNYHLFLLQTVTAGNWSSSVFSVSISMMVGYLYTRKTLLYEFVFQLTSLKTLQMYVCMYVFPMKEYVYENIMNVPPEDLQECEYLTETTNDTGKNHKNPNSSRN